MLEYSHIGNYQFQWTLSIPLPRYRIRVESIFPSCFFCICSGVFWNGCCIACSTYVQGYR